MKVKQRVGMVQGVLSKTVLFAYDAVSVIGLVLVWLLAVPTPAQAYVDPSVMTYTIQALAGVAVALSAVIGVAWRRIRRHVVKLLKVDDKREVEPDVHYYADGQVPAIQLEAVNACGTTVQTATPHRMGWVKRLLFALVPALACSLSLLLFSPLEMIVGAESQLAFKTTNVLGIMLVFALVCGVVLALILSVFWGKGYSALVTLVAACTLGMFLQSLVLNAGLPDATGISVAWGSFRNQMLIDAGVWALVIAAYFVMAHKLENLSRLVQIAVCAVLVLVQTVSLVTGVVAANNANKDAETVRMTEEGLFTVSKKKNTVVFILDTFDTEDILRLEGQDKDTLAAFNGFTFYKNSSGKMIPTRYAIPYLLSGVQPAKDETFGNWCRTMYDRSSFLSDIKDAGYSIGIYSDDGSVHHTKQIADKTINIHTLKAPDINAQGTIRILTKCGIYKSAPWVVKPFFWFYQDQLNENIVDHSNSDPAGVPYVEKDGAFHEKLVQKKLTASDEGQNGAFRFIHLLGTHAPYVLNAEGFQTGKSDIDAQARGSLKIVADYIQQLKDLGVYENTTIIVTADHGRFDFTASWVKGFDPNALGNAGLTNDGKDIGRATCPLWLIKPAQSAEYDTVPCQVSTVPTGHEDYAATVIDAIGGDYSKYGIPTRLVGPEPRTRTYLATIHDASKKIDAEWQEYEIRGDALNFGDWKKTGKVWN